MELSESSQVREELEVENAAFPLCLFDSFGSVLNELSVTHLNQSSNIASDKRAAAFEARPVLPRYLLETLMEN